MSCVERGGISYWNDGSQVVLVQALGYTAQHSLECESEHSISVRVSRPGALERLTYLVRATDCEVGASVSGGNVSGELLRGTRLCHGINLGEGPG